jgi:allantoate deiminase
MTGTQPSPGVARVLHRLETLFSIGGGPANRPGLSVAEQRAHDLVADWMAGTGLEVVVDTAGNLVGRAPGSFPELPEVWTGSHLDTVPDGGRFDGALGVVAGLEAVTAARARPHARTIGVVAFRDEEGWRFGQGYFGSRALCGRLGPGELDVCDAGGTSIRQALASLGLPPPGLLLPGIGTQPLPGVFVELHIEQGTSLADRGLALGVVGEIVAMAGLTVRFSGERAHAGGAAMTQRQDALVAAARFVLGAHSLARSDAGWRATVGELTVHRPAANVIADKVTAGVDVRARSDESLDRLVAGLREVADGAARQSGCAWEASLAWQEREVSMSPSVSQVLADAAGEPAAQPIAATSWAGHDAAILAAAGIPAGMLFVRAGRAGVSHSPQETADAADISMAIETLGRALTNLAGGELGSGQATGHLRARPAAAIRPLRRSDEVPVLHVEVGQGLPDPGGPVSGDLGAIGVERVNIRGDDITALIEIEVLHLVK